MFRRIALILTAAALLLAARSTEADDFGDFLKGAGKAWFEKQTSEEELRHLLAPFEMDAEIYTTRTLDGWRLVAHRYRTRRLRPGAPPIILCHGLSYSALFWDLDPDCSLPRYLAERGYDVWSVSLRGGGLSRKWVWKLETAPAAVLGGALRRLTDGQVPLTGYASTDLKYADWSLDDHIAYDVPALVALVRGQTGVKQIAWVGHSLGGIIALGHLERHGNPGIGRLVTIGSQVTMPDGQLFIEFLLEAAKTRSLQLGGQLNTNQLLRDGKESVDNLFFNEGHVHPKVYAALCSWANDMPALSLMKQYRVMARYGELVDVPRTYNFAQHLDRVKVPILIAAGAGDQLAPPPVQRYLYDHVGSTDKKLVLIGRHQGFAVDAGHNDAVVGLSCRNQVYPLIERWLAERATAH